MLLKTEIMPAFCSVIWNTYYAQNIAGIKFASLCGKVYCETCIKKTLEENNSCPSCRAPRPDLWPDKRLKQSLSGYRVYCCHRGKVAPVGSRKRREDRLEGCEWMGELGELDKHLNLKPSPGNQLYGCEYAKIECKFCSERFQRKDIDSHQLTKCPKRTFNCTHCDYIDTYEVVTKTHFSLCPKFPMPCSKCKNKYERQNLENHVNKECPLTPVPCDFHVVGCTEEPARENMDSHLRKDLVSHASMLQNHLSQHPNDASKCLPLVARCLGQLITDNQENLQEVERKFQESHQKLFALMVVVAVFLHFVLINSSMLGLVALMGVLAFVYWHHYF